MEISTAACLTEHRRGGGEGWVGYGAGVVWVGGVRVWVVVPLGGCPCSGELNAREGSPACKAGSCRPEADRSPFGTQSCPPTEDRSSLWEDSRSLRAGPPWSLAWSLRDQDHHQGRTLTKRPLYRQIPTRRTLNSKGYLAPCVAGESWPRSGQAGTLRVPGPASLPG